MPQQHTTNTSDEHPCPQWDSNPRPQQSSDRRPTPEDCMLTGIDLNKKNTYIQ